MKKRLLLIFLCFNAFLVNAQLERDNSILGPYTSFFETPREQVFVHLNKTTLVKGEALGFSAYVLDAEKNPSTSATNLYCTITDSTNTIIKQKLILVQKRFSAQYF